MTSSAHFANFVQALSKATDALRQEFMSLRTNKVNPQLLERLKISAYGSEMSLNQLGTIAAIDGRTLEIRPWDPAVLLEIEKAILKSDLGVSPHNDGKVIRLVFPTLTQERRQELVRVARRYAEEGRVRIRNARRDALEEVINKPLKEKKITEDEKFRRQQELDQITNKWIAEIDQLLSAKEKEILTI